MSFVKIISLCGVLGIISVCLLSSSAWSQPSDSTVTAIPGAIPYLYGWFTLNPEAEEKVPLLEQIDGGQVMIVSLHLAPPGDLRFVPFPNEPTRLVDIATQNLSGFFAQPLVETARDIQVYVAFDESALPSADEYPMQAEGNLSGGEGEGEPPHYNVQTGLLDLVIYNGQDGAEVPEDKEETVGAFTVANLNNTDSDDKADNDPDDVLIPGEKDMIELEIKKSSPNMTGNVTLTITGDGTQVKLWKAETKAGGAETKRTWSATELPVIVWVEGLAKSAAVRDIEAAIKYNNNVVDKAKLTFVWAELLPGGGGAAEHDIKAAATLWTLNDWKNTTTPPKDKVNFVGGTGLRPEIQMADGSFALFNCIIMKFRVFPKDIWKEPGIQFDITRQKEVKKWKQENGTWVESPVEAFPANDEMPNDDTKDTDESVSPNSDDEQFVMDAPGMVAKTATWDGYASRRNYNEFARIQFDGIRPTGNEIKGSRCSNKYEWHARQTLVKDPQTGRWKRDSGDAVETNTNDVGDAHQPLTR